MPFMLFLSRPQNTLQKGMGHSIMTVAHVLLHYGKQMHRGKVAF